MGGRKTSFFFIHRPVVELEKGKLMNHKVKVEVSKNPEGVVSIKKTKVKNSLLKRLFGTTDKTILILGDTVKGVSIYEVPEGGKANG